MRLRSDRLAVRLVRWLALAQIGSVLMGMAAWMLFSHYVTFRDVAAEQARMVVGHAVARGSAGTFAFRADRSLADYAARRPGFSYAASIGGQVIPGSTPTLARYLELLGEASPGSGRLELPRSAPLDPIIVGTQDIAGQQVVIATAGNAFGADDLVALFTVYFRSALVVFAPAVLTALIIVPLVVHRALMPLREAAREAEAIGFNTLERRLPMAGLTREVAPFVATINALLERLAAGARRQRRFSANAAHELRTPTAILQARLAQTASFEGKLELERDARRIAMLVDQLLAVARLNRIEAAPMAAVRLDHIARDVVGDCAPLAFRQGRDLALASDDPVTALGEAEALRSAVMNLVDNAIRAEPEGGLVEVACGRDKAATLGWVEVRDHGCGVPEDARERVFEPFWRSGDTGPGTGLGLAIVREIVVAHGGTVQMMPRTGEAGTIFRIELPAA